ncbi:hypothetical protein Tsp_06696, partial [Trichinella spiralis]
KLLPSHTSFVLQDASISTVTR